MTTREVLNILKEYNIPKKVLMSNQWQRGMDHILKETIKILRGYDWSIGYGTVLGKVRHNNYIPWDDDIDIFLSIKKDEVKGFKEKLIKNKIPFQKMFFGFTLFGPYPNSPFLDIMIVDKNWKYHNRRIPTFSKGWADPNFKGKMVSSRLRGIPIKMPNMKDRKKHLSDIYGDYMKTWIIKNHRMKDKYTIKFK